jgi:hypothetical protein
MEELGDDSAGPWANSDTIKDPYQLALENYANNASTEETLVIVPKVKEAVMVDVESEVKNPRMHIIEPEEEEEMWEKVNEKKQTFILPPRPNRGAVANEVCAYTYTYLCIY